MSLVFSRYKLSVERYNEMIRAGILTENDPVELIRGELLEKMPRGDVHVETVNRLARIFARTLAESVTVSVQNPIVLADSEPEPDLALYTLSVPGKARASDVHLVIEVADSSLHFDRTVKLALYAEAGIPEYWIVNLLEEQVEVHRQPELDGTYAAISTAKRGDIIEPLAFPELKIAVGDVLV